MPSSTDSDPLLLALQPSLASSTSSDSNGGESNNRNALLQALQLGGGVGVSEGSTMDDIVSGVSLIYLKSPALVCGGAIGNSGCACAVPKDICDIVSHDKKKADWPEEPSLFLLNKGKKDLAVYVEPYLPTALLESDDELKSLLQQTFSLESWSEKVSLYEFANSTGYNLSKAGEEIKAIKEAMKTPAPKGGSKRLVDFEASISRLALVDQKKSEEEPVTEKMQDMINALLALHADSQKGGPKAIELFPMLKLLAEYSQTLVERDDMRREHAQETTDYMKAEFGSLNTLLGALNVDVQGLKTLIGSRQDDSVLSGNIFEMLGQLELMIRNSGVLDVFKNSTSVVSKDLLRAAIIPYKNAIETLDTKLTKAIEGSRGGFIVAGTGRDADFALHTAPSISRVPQVAVTKDTTWEKAMEKKLEDLTRMVTGAKNAGDSGVSFRNFSFQNRNEFGAWLSKNEGRRNVSLSLFQCHVTILHRIYTALIGSHRDLREAKAMSDMKVRDFDVNAAQALHTSGLPSLLRGTNKSGTMFTGANTGGQKHRFGGCGTYGKYGDPSNPDGLRYRALESLEEVYRTIQTDIENDIVDPLVKNLANLMLTRTDKFVRDLFNFMTDTYVEYLGSFGDSDRTWDFVCQCVEKILTSEFQEARSLANGMDFSDPDFNLKMIWCSLRIASVQEKFLEVGMANHSVLSSTVSRYLIKNTNAGNVDSLRARLGDHQSTISELEAAVAELKLQVRSATSLADKANAAIKRLSKEDVKTGSGGKNKN